VEILRVQLQDCVDFVADTKLLWCEKIKQEQAFTPWLSEACKLHL
jgi:hypothetical protein